MSVGDYLDRYRAEPGATAGTVEAIVRIGQLGDHASVVCKIGAGSGRYAKRATAALHPDRYEVYETARDWLPYLRTLPNVVVQPADGRTLAATSSDSVDLVHAHKTFVYIPFVTTLSYLQEMARVVRPGGIVAFDVVTEECMDDRATKTWVTANATLYLMTPRAWTIDLLDRHGLALLGSHFIPLSGGRTELLVLQRRR